MSYPRKLLSSGETIGAEFRPHWSSILRELLLLMLTLVFVILGAINGFSGWVLAAISVAAVALVAKGLIRWYTTIHVITNERVIYRSGLISKRGKEIPLEVVNDVAFSQSVFERIFGTGDLLIESAGEQGQSRYTDIPNPEGVQSLIYSARETRTLQLRGVGTATSGESTASQLATLSRLLDEGKLTVEEFAREKSKLLGGL